MEFVKVKPSETAGSRTSKRYDYQKNVSLCLLLERHDTDEDYLFVFDYHDDLVVLQPSEKSTEFDFYQIKSKSTGNWKIRGVLSKKSTVNDGKKQVSHSILGKLFNHTIQFGTVNSVNLVSNAKFDCKLSDQTSGKVLERVCLIDLCDEESNLINEKLLKEFELKEIDSGFYEKAFFIVHKLSIEDSSTHAKGVLTDFLDKWLDGKKYNVTALYTTLFDEIKRKTAYDKEVRSFEDLVKFKGISRDYFENSILSVIGIGIDYEESWREVQQILISESVKFKKLNNYKNCWKRLELERMNPNNHVLKKCISEIKNTLKSLDSNSLEKLVDIIANIKSKIAKYPFDSDFLETIIMFEVYENRQL